LPPAAPPQCGDERPVGRLRPRVLGVAVFVDDELPIAVHGTGSAEVREVEGQDRQGIALGDRHDRGVGVSEVEIRVGLIDFNCAPQQCGRDLRDGVLAGGQGPEEQASRAAAHARAQEVIDLDDDRLGDEESPAELADQACGQGVRLVAAVRCGQKRSGVGDDSQGVCTGSLR
jgi:hypothetical protein